MSTINDIAVIAKKSLEDSNKVTESDCSAILSGALEDIEELCQRKQDEKQDLLRVLETVKDGIAQLQSGIACGMEFHDGVIIHKAHSLQVLRDMWTALEDGMKIVQEEKSE